MSSPYALFRLMWRPLLAAMLFFVLLAIAFPLAQLETVDGWNPFWRLWHTGDDPQVRVEAWRLVSLLPVAVGAVLSTLRLEVTMSQLGWTLPGIRRGWQNATLFVAVPIALVLATIVWRGGPPAEAAAAFALSAFWFLVPGALMLAGLPCAAKYALGGLLIASFALAVQVRALVAGASLAIALLAAAGAVLLFRHHFSAATARRQSSMEEVLARMWDRGSLWRSFGSKGEWSHRLQDAGLGRWLLAASHEAGHGSLLRYARSVAWAVLFGGAMVHLLGGSHMLPLWLGMMIGGRAMQLQSVLPYPLSRRARAELAFVGGLVEAVTVTIGILLVLWGLSIVGMPMLAPFDDLERTPLSLPLAMCAAFTWLPIMIWGSIRPMQLQTQPRQPGFVGRMGAFVLYIFLTMGSADVLRGVSSGEAMQAWQVWLLLAAGLITYPGLWVVTRRHFATADLVPLGP